MRTPEVQAAGHRAWPPFIAIVALAACAWGLAAWGYSGDSARASAEPKFRAVDTHLAVPAGGEWYTVSVEFLMLDNGSGSFAAAAAAAEAELVGRFPGAIVLDDDGVSAQFVLNGYFWTTHGAAWGYNSTGKPPALNGEAAAIQAAAGTWSAAGFQFTGGAPSGSGTGACSGGGLDGQNTVGWAAQSGSVLAVTCTWYSQSGNPHPAIEFDMQFDPDWPWTTGAPQVDVQSVALHEFGHALGLGHSADGSAVMYPSYTAGTLKQSLSADDIAGAQQLYGGGANPTATPTSAPTSTPTPAGNPPTPTPTPGPGATQTPTPTSTPTNQGGGGSTPTPSPTPSSTATPNASATATATPSPTPTTSATATATPTVAPTSPGASPTPRPSLPLRPGSNLMTWPGASAHPSRVISANSGINAVYSWDATTGSWKRYFPGLPDYVNTLQQIDQGGAYWFVSSSAVQVPYTP